MKNSSKIQKFWQWFEENKFHYTDFESEWDPGMNLLTDQLHKIDSELSFEITSESGGLCEIVITANGNIEKFPVVRAVVNNAPYISGWRIVAFKQAIGADFTLRNELFEVSASDMYFFPFMEEEALTIIIYGKDIKGISKDDSIFFGIDILINIIGEYDVATKVSLCFLEDLEEAHNESIIPLPKIKEYIDEIYYNCN